MAEGARRAILAWHRSDGSTVDFPLGSRALVGREVGATVRIDEPLVSRAHAEIVRRGETYVVRDLKSTNSTRVNGEIVSECALRDGDEVRFGRARCVFRHVEAQDAPAGDEADPS
jgi:pSer/pThr/pTyr-binding forkhead associated (FHA) protein